MDGQTEHGTQPDHLPGDLPAAAARAIANEPDRWPVRMAEMIDIMLDEMRRSGTPSAASDQRALAVRLVVRQCQEYGGSREYWPKADSIERILRDARIWAEHDGTVDGPNGVRAIAKRHRITDVQVWAILRSQRALHLAQATQKATS